MMVMTKPKVPKAPQAEPVAKPTPKRGRGRPEHERTDALSVLVKTMTAFGHPLSDVMAATGLGEHTLRKYYGSELNDGRMQVRAEVLTMLYTAATGGNVSAQKHLEVMTSGREKNDGKGASYQLPAAKAAPAEKPEKVKPLGKKAQALADAQNPDLSNPMGQLMARRHQEGPTRKPH